MDEFYTNIINKQNALITLLELKCKELDYILSSIDAADDKQAGLKAFSTSINSTLKLILKEEKSIREAMEKILSVPCKINIPKPDFSEESVPEKFEKWNPEIEHPQEITFRRVYEIPNNFHQ